MKHGLKRALALMLALMLAVPAFALADEPAEGIIVIGDGDEAVGEVQLMIGEALQPPVEELGEITLGEVELDVPGDPASDEPAVAEEASAEPFDQAVTVDDVTITVIAGPGVFPAGAALRVTKVSDAEIARAVEAAIGAEGVYTHRQYRIEVLDGAGNVIRSEYEHDWPTVRVEGLNLPADARVTAYDEYVPGAYEIDVAVVPDEDAVEFELVDFTVYDIITVEALTGEAEGEGASDETTSSVSPEGEPASPEGKPFGEPVEEVLIEEQPIEEVPAEGDDPQEPSPVGEGGSAQALAEEVLPVEEVPIEEQPTEQPAEGEAEEPTEEQPAEGEAEEPTEEQPAEGEAEEPTEEQPAEEVPVEEVPVEEEPVEDETEEPADQPTEGDDAQKPSPSGEGAERSEAEEVGTPDETTSADEGEEETTSSVSPDGEPASPEGEATDGEGAEQPAEEAPVAEEPAEQPAEGAAEDPAEQPAEAEAEEPAEQPAEAEAEEPADQPAEGETEEPTEESTDQPAEGETEEPTEEPADQPTEDEPSQPAPFFQSATVDGVTVTVRAEVGAFPEGAVLSVRKVSAETAEAVDAAVANARDSAKNDARDDAQNNAQSDAQDSARSDAQADAQDGAQATLTSYTFDISILDAEGNELQPAEGFDVQVSFALAQAAEEGVRASVYHIDETGGDMTAEKLNIVEKSGDTVTAVTDGFSLYNVTLATSVSGGFITYVLADGVTEQKAYDWQELTEENIGGGGWYAVAHDTVFNGSLNVNSDANLILFDGTTLTCNDGIYIVAGATLTIWGQKGGTGKLVANDKIGGSAWSDGGNLVVNGGDIHATGKSSTRAAGIGGGEGHAMQSVTINGGKVTAEGANGGAGIGAGYAGNASGMTVTINGGEVTAKGSGKGAGIGGGDENWSGAGGEGATVHINGGWVFAASDGIAIGRGNTDEVMGTLTIADDLKVEAGNSWPDFVVERTFTTPERVAACQWRKSARISKCGHDQWHWDNNAEGHMKVCETCATAFPREEHTLDEKEVCETCGYDRAAARVTYVLADGVTEAEKFDLPDVPLDMADGNWYVVRKDTTFNDGMGVGSDANLILCDGVTLTCNDGIYVRANATLTIYGQKGGTGKIITRSETKTGIGGLRNAVGGHIVINGGTIEATGGKYCAGIGGGEDNFCQSVTINNGTVTATGGKHGAGIGGGEEASIVQITITGGTVTATGGEGGAGIGGGYKSHAEHINISGGKVTAISGDVTDGSGAAIGTGGNCKTEWVSNDSIEISGGDVTAMAGKNSVVYENIYGSKKVKAGGSNSAAIGGGYGCSNPRITISGGTVKADAIAHGGAAIGSGSYADMAYPIEISGGKVTAYGGHQSAGIGAGVEGNLTSEVLISGGEVTALSNTISISGGSSGSAGSGIGTGYRGSFTGKITITGGTVHATGSYNWQFYVGRHELARYGAAGIGSEHVRGTITISGGDVTAIGGMFSAGIGGSGGHDSGEVSGSINISGGTVRAYGAQIGDPPLDMPTGGPGIGAGGHPSGKGVLSGSINISGGTVYAEGCKNAVILGGEGVYERGKSHPRSPSDDYFYWVETTWQNMPGPGIGSIGDITGSINITGGTVHASADTLSPGIGSLYSNRGAIRITGGTVYAKGGKDSPGAIGRGKYGSEAGTIILGDTMAVRQGINDKKPNPWEAAAERLAAITKYGEVTAKPCDHSVKFAIETETHQGYCEWCALPFEKEKHIFDEDGNCVVCGEGVEEPTFRTHSLSLSGNIAVNFMVQLPKGMDIKGTYMEFAVNGETSRQDTDADRRDANGVGYYRFTRSLNSIQMAEPIKAVFHYGDGKTIEQSYSIRQYIEDYEARKGSFDAETTALVHALADYGHYAQIELAEARDWVIGEDYAEMTTFYTEGYDYDAVKDSLSDYTIKKTSNDKDYEKATVALDLLSETRLDVYVAYKEGTDKIVSVSADGNWLQNLKLRDAKDGRVYAHFDSLRAQQLSDVHTVVCTAGGKKVTVEVSALGYIHDVLASEQTAKLKDCVCALYNYHKATVEYRKKHG